MNSEEFIPSENLIDINHYEQLKLNNYTTVLKNEYNFMTESSKNINNSLIFFAEKVINRGNYIMKLNKLLDNLKIAIQLELSIFEYALVHTTVNNLEIMFVSAIYTDKFNEICMNLDETSYLGNHSLKENILNGSLGPQIIAFLSPEQLHPAKWTEIIKKQQYRTDKEQNMATTDMYQCRKCKEKKCTVARAQIRSLDEPTTSVVSCRICGNVWMF